MAREFRVIQGNPAPAVIAPYIYLVTKHAHVNSIYRGDDAAAILHHHGKHTQRELYDLGYPANRPGHSSHELFGDGHIYGVPDGAHLEDWQVGIDVNDADVYHVIARAEHYGWVMFQPYTSGAEFHHVNFAHRPESTGHLREQIKQIRDSLPRR